MLVIWGFFFTLVFTSHLLQNKTNNFMKNFTLLCMALFIAIQSLQAQVDTCFSPIITSPTFPGATSASLGCGPPPAVDFTAYFNIAPSISTSTYGVTTIPYNPVTTLGTAIPIGTDDIWGSIIPLPFSFCFYGNSYTSLVIGSNGIITFDTTLAGGYCAWSLGAALPTTSYGRASISGVYHDIDPSVPGLPTKRIDYQTIGTAPCRSFVIRFVDIPYFSCTGLNANHQIILHEGSNIVDVQVGASPICSGWNGGLGIIGLQDYTRTAATFPLGYNRATFSITTQAWRFYPYDTTHIDSLRAVLYSGSTPIDTVPAYYSPFPIVRADFTVTPVFPPSPQVYHAELIVTIDTSASSGGSGTSICIGSGSTNRTNDFVISSGGSVSVGTAVMNPTCHGDTNGMIMSFITAGVAPFTYLWDRAGETTSDLTGVSAGVYNLTVTDSSGCSTTVTTIVREPDLLQIQLDSLKPVSCYGINDAAVYITPVGGNGGYTYSWDHGFLTQDITGLSADSTYCLTLHDSLGCRTDTCYHISPVTQSIINFFPTICAGEVYVVGANSYSVTGVYNDTTLNIYGCDSINIFHLNVLPVAAHSIVRSICDGQALNVGSSIYTSSGRYIDTLTSYNGCDSVITTDLTVLLNSTHLINDSLCFGQSVRVGSNVYNTSGVFYDTLTNANGCDSVVTTTLFIYPNHLTLVVDSLCAGESFMGNTIYNDTVLNTSLPDVHGCDSGIVYNIHVYISQKPFLGPDRNIIVGDSVFIILDVGVSFVWSTGATTSQITAAPIVTTSYWVSSTDSNGCVASDTINVNVRPIGDTLALPSAFSPNSDGVNDYYYPLLMPGMILEDFTIFNRWGATVYTGTASPGWDGNFMGSPQPIGNYVFYCRVSVPDPLSPGSFITRYYNGVVTLLR